MSVVHINVQAVQDDDNYVGDGSCSPEGYLEIIKDRLYWASVQAIPKNNNNYHYFSEIK
jgi:hypothetical protein